MGDVDALKIDESKRLRDVGLIAKYLPLLPQNSSLIPDKHQIIEKEPNIEPLGSIKILH